MDKKLVSSVWLAVILVASACSGQPTGSTSNVGAAGMLSINSPVEGSTVVTETVTIRGHAPAGSRIVRDISFGPDAEATALSDGSWTMTVKLDEGANQLLFRIADDKSTTVTLALMYASGSASSSGVATFSTPPTPSPLATAAPKPTATPKPTPKPTPVPTPKPITYAKLTSRNWAKLVKDPDAYIAKTYQVWACIAQFDAATGTDTFRGQASYARQEYWFTDGDNALFNGDESELSDFVQDDVVVMNVTVLGSFNYDTQIGGSTTVPLFFIDKITHKGSC